MGWQLPPTRTVDRTSGGSVHTIKLKVDLVNFWRFGLELEGLRQSCDEGYSPPQYITFRACGSVGPESATSAIGLLEVFLRKNGCPSLHLSRIDRTNVGGRNGASLLPVRICHVTSTIYYFSHRHRLRLPSSILRIEYKLLCL